MISHFQGVFVLDGEKFADFSLARAKYSEKSRLSTSQLHSRSRRYGKF